MAVTLNISITQKMRDYIDLRVQDGDFVSASDYIRCLLRTDSKRRLEDMLVEGQNSGHGVEFGTPEWDTFMQELNAVINASVEKQKEDAA